MKNQNSKAVEKLLSIKNQDDIKNLIDSGYYINAQDSNGSTALMLSLIWGKMETAKLLLEAGADFTKYKDNQGFNAEDRTRMVMDLSGNSTSYDLIQGVKLERRKRQQMQEKKQKELEEKIRITTEKQEKIKQQKIRQKSLRNFIKNKK